MPTFPFTLAAIFGEEVTLTLEKITDHVERAKARMLEQYRDKVNFEAWVSIYAARIQQLEDVLFQLLEERSLSTAVGVQLDVLGRILNLNRGGYGDEDYRTHLRARALLLRSSGTINQVLGVLAMVLPSASLELREAYPASFAVRVGDVVVNEALATLLALFVRKARPSAVYAVTEWKPQSESATFKWDTSGQGWDNGKWSGATES